MKEYLLFDAQIQNAYIKMTSAERRIAEYLLKDPEILLDSTAQSLAQSNHVSTATIVRFCRSCGYDGLPDMKRSFQKEYRSINSQSEDGVQKNDSFDVVRKRALGLHDMILRNCLDKADSEKFREAAEAILQAKRIIISGEGGSRPAAMMLYDLLLQSGFHCRMIIDNVFEILEIGNLQQGDVLILFSYTGILRTAYDNLRAAKKKNATTIGFIGRIDAPMNRYTDILLLTNCFDKDYFDSSLSVRISEFTNVELLYSLLHAWGKTQIEQATYRNELINARRLKRQEYDLS